MFFVIGLYLDYGNDKVLMSSLTQSKYYDGLHEELNQKINELAAERSIPEDVLKDVVTSEKIFIDSNNYITKTLDGQYENINTDVIENGVKEKVTNYLNEQQVEITSSIEESINSLAQLSSVIYKNKIELKFIDYYKEYQKTLNKTIGIVLIITIVFIAISSVLVIRMYRSKHKGVRFIAYGLIGSIYMNLMSILFFNPIKGLDITPDYYREFLELFIHKCKMQNMLLVVVQLVILSVLFYLIRLLKKGI